MSRSHAPLLSKGRTRRWWLWLPLLAVLLWLVLLAEDPGGSTAGVAEAINVKSRADSRGAGGRTTNSSRKSIEIEPLQARTGDPCTGGSTCSKLPSRDLFRPPPWVTPPPNIASAAPPAPVAPPLPFIVLGKKQEDGEWEVFLGRGDQVLLVREGQSIDTQYRVEQIQPPLLSLTYLPLNTAQTLSIGDAR